MEVNLGCKKEVNLGIRVWREGDICCGAGDEVGGREEWGTLLEAYNRTHDVTGINLVYMGGSRNFEMRGQGGGGGGGGGGWHQ